MKDEVCMTAENVSNMDNTTRTLLISESTVFGDLYTACLHSEENFELGKLIVH